MATILFTGLDTHCSISEARVLRILSFQKYDFLWYWTQTLQAIKIVCYICYVFLMHSTHEAGKSTYHAAYA